MKKKKAEIIHKLYSALLSGYIVGLLWLVPSLVKDTYSIRFGLIKLIVAIISGIIIYICLNKAYEKFDFTIVVDKNENKKYFMWFIIGFSISFLIMMLYFYAFFPGSFTSDNIQQWEQVQSGQFSNWHPVLHTYLIYLVSRIINHYSFVVFIHILLFSCACGYLLTAMARWKLPKWCMILTEAFIILNPMTRHMFIGLLKDATFSICVLILSAFLINIFLSKGNWFKSIKNCSCFTIIIVLLTIIRHNGLLLTVPLMLLMIWIIKKQSKRIIIAGLIALFCIVMIKNPMYNMLDVERPQNEFLESVGIPMTILCNIKVQEPGRLTEDANKVMNAIGYKDEVWDSYEYGNFNSIKWNSGACEYLNQVNKKHFMTMIGQMIIKEPALSLQAVYQLTRMGWDIRGNVNWNINTACYDNQWEYKWDDNRAGIRNTIFKTDIFMWTKFTKYFFSFAGVYIILLMLVGFLCSKRYGLSVLYIVLPVLCYDFGTMLLLCGTDYRFFHFNSMIVIPLCLVMLVKVRNEHNT